MKVAAAYIRVSTDDQIEFSPDSQLEKIKLYAEKNQMLLPKDFIFLDEGISGTSVNKREEFLKMIEDAKKHKFDLILTKEISRFSRIFLFDTPVYFICSFSSASFKSNIT